jgi:hypothetical protein
VFVLFQFESDGLETLDKETAVGFVVVVGLGFVEELRHELGDLLIDIGVLVGEVRALFVFELVDQHDQFLEVVLEFLNAFSASS